MKKIIDTMELFENLVEEYEINEGLETNEATETASEVFQDVLESEIMYASQELNNFIARYEKRYHTDIEMVAMIGRRSSHYGAIGGNGASVGRIVEVSNDTLEELVEGMEYSLLVTDNGTLEVSSFDHDGNNSMELVLMTASEAERAEDQDEDYLVFLENKKATKLDKMFKNAFGI